MVDMMKTRRPFSLGNLYASNFTGGYDPREKESVNMSSDTDVINKQLREPYEETLPLSSSNSSDVRLYSNSSNQGSGSAPVETSGNLNSFYNNAPKVEEPSTTEQAAGLAQNAISNYAQRQLTDGASNYLGKLFSGGGGLATTAAQNASYNAAAGAATNAAYNAGADVATLAAGQSTAAGTGAATTTGGGAGAGLAGLWPLAAIYGATKVYGNVRENQKKGGPGLTSDEIYNSFGNRRVNEFADKATFGLHKDLSKFDLTQFAAGKLLGSGKGDDQILRDRIREKLVDFGIATKVGRDPHLTLADGSTWLLDRDGNSKVTNSAGESRSYREYDKKDPLAVSLAEYAKPLAAAFTGNDPKFANDFTGYFVNAATSNAKTLDEAKKNLAHIYSNSGHKRYELNNLLQGYVNDKKLSLADFNNYKSKLKELFPGQTITLEGMDENGEEISPVQGQRVYQRGLADILPKVDIPKPPQQVYNPYNEKKGNLSNYSRTRV